MPRRYKVLAIAEAANPEWVSVPLVGWSLARALADVADVHLVTQIRNRDAILRAGVEEGRDFTAIDSEKVAALAHRAAGFLRMGEGRGWTMVTALDGLAYPYFEHLVWRRFGAEIQAGDWDVVHRITPLSPTATSPIGPKVAKAGVPFVVGPLNGGVPWPPGFGRERRAEREWLSYLRQAYKLHPGRGRTLRAASAILTGSGHTRGEMPAGVQEKCIHLPENAVDPARFDRVATQDAEGPLKGIFVGRLVPYKGPDMAIEAAAPLLASGRMTLDIVGDGPMRAELESLTVRLDVAESVRFHGNLPHAEVASVLASAHVLVFPSIREFGGGVVLEAMATGVLPLVVNYAGPGELVDDSTGVTVPVGPRADIIEGFSARLEDLCADRGRVRALAAAARAHALERFTWDAKARQILSVYDWVTGAREDRPDPLGESA